MTKFKFLFYSILAVSIVFFCERVYQYVIGLRNERARLHTELVGATEKYKQLSEYSAKLELQYTDEKDLKEKLEIQFSKEKEILQGRIKLLSNATFSIRERARIDGKSDLSYQGTETKYIVNELRYAEGPPVGYVLIFDDGRVVSKLYNHVIDVKTAVSRDEESGKYSVVSKADYVLKSPSINLNGEKVWTNKPYPLKITGGTAFVDPTEKNPLTPHLMLWAPHLNGGLSMGAGASGGFIRPTVDLSVAGFGVSRNDLDWKFVHLGFDVNSNFSEPGVHLSPFSYRFWPSVLTNTYVGPALGWTQTGANLQLNLNLTF